MRTIQITQELKSSVLEEKPNVLEEKHKIVNRKIWIKKTRLQ